MLKAVVSQRLMPRADGKGRAPAVEVMISTPFIRDCIVDKEKTHLIHGAIAAGTSQYGMQTFDQSIFGLFQQGLVSYEEALRWASNVDEFKLRVQGISTTAEHQPRPDGQHHGRRASDHALRAIGVAPSPADRGQSRLLISCGSIDSRSGNGPPLASMTAGGHDSELPAPILDGN